MSSLSINQSRALLEAADVFYCDFDEDDEDEDGQNKQTLNMSDMFGWAQAFGEYVPDEKLSEVGTLFLLYGHAGLLYWVSEQHGGMRSEFEDINRRIDFVRHEEKLIKQIPDSDKRAYEKLTYVLGETHVVVR